MAGPAQLTQWQLEGNAADAYERYLVPTIFEPWARDLVDLASIRPGHRVLDVACGTGIVARLAAPRVGPAGAVRGLDLNADMLAVAATACAGVSPAIEWTQGDVEKLPYPDAHFDVALSQFALMFFPDRVRALAEMRRVTVPTGLVALSVWRSLEINRVYLGLAAALERHAGSDAAVMMGSPFALGDAGELRDLLSAAGFRDIRIRIDVKMERFPSPEEMIRREAASSPLAGPLGQLDDAARAGLVAEVSELLREHTDDESVAFPLEAYIVTARP